YPDCNRGTVCQMPHALALMQQAWSGIYTVHGALEQADCVVGFAFARLVGGKGEVLPGISNQALSAFAYRHCSHLPKILQSEIAVAYAKDFPCDSTSTHIVTEHRQKGRYLDTRETAEQAWLMLQAHNWRTALVLAHVHYMPRAIAVCRKLGMSTVALP